MKVATFLSTLLSVSLVNASTTQLVARDDPSPADQWYNGQVQQGQCPVYIGANRPENDRSLEICQQYCKDHDHGRVITCDAQRVVETFGKPTREIDPNDYHGQYLTDPDGFPYIPIDCACDNKEVEIIADWVVKGVVEGLENAFGKFVEFFCSTVLPAVMTIVDIGISAIPVAGPTYRGVSTAVKVAKSFAENGLDAAQMFMGSSTPSCSNPLDFDIVSVFTNLIETPDEVGTGIGCIKNNKACKNLPKSKPENKPRGKPEGEKPKDEKPNNEKPNDEKPNDEKPKPGATTTSDRAKETDNASNSCKLKRSTPKLYRVSGDRSEKPGQPEVQRGVESTECNNGVTTTIRYEVTSVQWQANPTEVVVTKTCDDQAGQACHHYQSAIERNPQWATLPCPGLDAAKGGRERSGKSKAVKKWGDDVAPEWKNEQWRDHPNNAAGRNGCQLDEFPPYYMLTKEDEAWKEGGNSMKGQLIRYIPNTQNSAGGDLWKGLCFFGVFTKYDAQSLWDRVTSHQLSTKQRSRTTDPKSHDVTIVNEVKIETEYRPSLAIDFQQSDQDPPGTPLKQKIWGLRTDLNKCLPFKSLNHDGTQPFDDPGFALLRFDTWNEERGRDQWDYKGTKPKAQSNNPPAQNNPPPAQNNPPSAQNNPPPAQNNPSQAQNNPLPAQNNPPPAQNNPPPAQNKPPPASNNLPGVGNPAGLAPASSPFNPFRPPGLPRDLNAVRKSSRETFIA